MARAGHRSRVPVLAHRADGKRAGLLLDSVVMPDNLATIHAADIDGVIGSMLRATGLA